MRTRYVFSSMIRISDLAEVPFDVEALPRNRWETGDYVVGRVLGGAGEDLTVELPCGRMTEAAEGDLIVGALGRRFATLEATGTWERIGADGQMYALTEGGLFGMCLSRSGFIAPLMSLAYRGHVVRDDRRARMRDFVPPVASRAFETPAVLLIGSSMSAGKTMAARVVIRLLKASGLSVLGAKLTGAGRYHDALTMGDAGADAIFDFVDAGLPSTVCPAAEYRGSVRPLLSRMAGVGADAAVLEVGSSPLEPYNGAVAIEEVGASVRVTILCASDPYAVVGIMTAFRSRPDLVTGPAANTEAGVALVERLTGVRALNLRDKAALSELGTLLREKFRPRAPALVPT